MAHGVGFGSARGYVRQCSPTILYWVAANKPPEIRVETSEFFFNREKTLRVLNRSCDFQPVPHDRVVAEQTLHIAPAVAGDLFRTKSVECFSVVLALF